MSLPDFKIESNRTVSKHFLILNIDTFQKATNYVANLPYGRNKDKTNLLSIFNENCGTCSTKHALLKELADENGFEEIQLILGIFKMNARNTKPLSSILEKYNLKYIPEAHNYLKYQSEIYDFTLPNSDPKEFKEDIVNEISIKPNQILEFKIAHHKSYIENWLKFNPELNYSLDELWKIREECILELSQS